MDLSEVGLPHRSESLTALTEDPPPPDYPGTMSPNEPANLTIVNPYSSDDIEMQKQDDSELRRHYELIPTAPFPPASPDTLPPLHVDTRLATPLPQEIQVHTVVRGIPSVDATPSPVRGRSEPVLDDNTSQYYPVVYQPFSGKLYTNVNGFYHALPRQIGENLLQTRWLGEDTAPSAPTLHTRAEDVEPQGRTAPVYRDEQAKPVKDYRTLTMFAICVITLCLDLPVLLMCLAPALHYANKANNLKYTASHAAATYGRIALGLNIVAILVHLLLLVSIVLATAAILYWVLDIF